jgi:hypothetical protein
LPWNCTVFWIKPQEGMGWPSAPLRGPDGLEFWLQGTMLKVAPVSTKYLSLVNSTVRNIRPAFAGKCIAVAVACVGKAAEPKGVRRHISFLTKNRALSGFWKEWKSGREGGRLLGRALPPLLSPLFPLLGSGLLFRCVEAAATVGSWPPGASHRASAAFTMAAAVSWAPAPTVSLIDGGS